MCGFPSGERRGIGPSVDSCSVVMDESCERKLERGKIGEHMVN